MDKTIARCLAGLAALWAAAAIAQPEPGLTPPTEAAVQDCLAAAKDVPRGGGWYRPSPANTVIVFVHGILSDSRSAWLTTGSPCAFWPAIVASDVQRLGRPAIFLGGYDSGADAGSANVRDVAEQLYASLAVPSGTPMVAPLDHARIVFVAHSLGGIVVRRMLVEHADDFAGHEVALLLYASPAGGSPYADLLAWLEGFHPHALLRDLKTDAPALEQTNERFRDLLRRRREAGRPLRVAEFFEVRFPQSDCVLLRIGCRMVTALMPEIVPRDRAGHFDLPAVRVPDTDHVSIVKPHDREADSHRRLLLALSTFGMARVVPFEQGLGKLSVQGVLAKGQWVREGSPADLVTGVGALCDGPPGPAGGTPRLCRNRHEVQRYGEPPRDGDIGFVVLDQGVRNLAGQVELGLLSFPDGAERYGQAPVLSAVNAVLHAWQPPPDAPLSALFTVRYQPLRYRVTEQAWSLEAVVPAAPDGTVELAVPAELQSVEMVETSIAGQVRRQAAALAIGTRLGLLEVQDILRRGGDRVYRFGARPR